MGQEMPIRVLHIVGEMGRGGMETMVMNIYRNIDRSKVQFDFLAHYGGRYAAYNEEIQALGGRIYEMPGLKTDENHACYWKIGEYIVALNKFFREHQEYKIIHCHMTNTASIYMPIAEKYGVTCRIAHSHSTHGKEGLLGMATEILQRPTYKYATDWFACSQVAAYWFYPKKVVEAGKVTIIANAVDAKNFRYSGKVRNQMRKELGVEDKVVIGCVARFRPEKNHVFLISVLNEMLKEEPNAVLMFAGEGPLKESIKTQVAEKGLSSNVLFLGMRSDIPNVMQAMDVMVMPSLFEGLPVTGIEAQASGLRIVASTGVTEEMDAIGMVTYLSLEDSIKAWSDALLKAASAEREDTYEQIRKAGYDIHTTAPWLQEFYLNKAKD